MAERNRTTVVTAFLFLASALSAPAQVPLGSEFRVDRSGLVWSEVVITNPRSAAVARDGTFMLTWLRYDWPNQSILGRMFEPNGTPRPQELVINTNTTSFNENDAVAMDDAGNYVVVWSAASWEVRGRVGTGTEFLIGTSQRNQPAMAAAPDGKFVVVWNAASTILAQRFEADDHRWRIPGQHLHAGRAGQSDGR